MILTIFVVWLALAALAAFFLYCCSRVSNGPIRERDNDEFATEAPLYLTATTLAERHLSDRWSI